ncbi:inositol monophosphatase family protein [Cochlodiniinecator piscidefendens]|uniref:inositol monophosphatase family protein n=1 Tax=Cochlodiniinecator piscidefendens TaxID=2715756 RepID=UPI00140948BA|nr:inositol monophosphatase family protein [Cochlodiniinecator piscidefendens]
MPNENTKLQFAISLAEEAGKLAQSMRAEATEDFVQTKGQQDFVTNADKAVEALIRSKLAAAFPEDAFLGEEEGLSGSGQNYWVVDPIDGTTNFMRGFPDWAVSIAYCNGADILIGVICAPDLQSTAWAERGKGAFLNDMHLEVSQISALEHSILMTGRSGRRPVANYLHLLDGCFRNGMEYRRNGVATISLLTVALGRAEGYYEEHLNAWDAFAGMLIIQEAGGHVECDDIETFLSHGSRILASNGYIHDAIKYVVSSTP